MREYVSVSNNIGAVEMTSSFLSMVRLFTTLLSSQFIFMVQGIKAWPHDRENHTKSCDDFRELSSRFD